MACPCSAWCPWGCSFGRFKQWFRRRMTLMKFFGTVTLVLTDLLTDIVNGILLINRADYLGATCGILTLIVILLPGLTFGITDATRNRGNYAANSCGMVLQVCWGMIKYPFVLVFKGLQSLHNPENMDIRVNFEKAKPFEAILEGGLQACISMYLIMMSEQEIPIVTWMSVFLSILSTFVGCIQHVKNSKPLHNTTLRFPSYPYSALALPEVINISISSYAVTSTLTDPTEKLLIKVSLILIFITLGLWSITRGYRIFLSKKRLFVFEHLTKRRESELRSGSTLKTGFREDLPADPFWNVQDQTIKQRLLASYLLSDLVITLLVTIATVWMHLRIENYIMKVVLTVLLIFRSLVFAVAISYYFKPHILVDYNHRTIQIIEFGEMLYPFYTRQNKHEELVKVHQIITKLYISIDALFLIEETTDDIFATMFDKLTDNLKQYQNSYRAEDTHFDKVETFLLDLDQLLTQLCDKHWNSQTNVFDKDSVPYIKEIEQLIDRLANDFETDGADWNEELKEVKKAPDTEETEMSYLQTQFKRKATPGTSALLQELKTRVVKSDIN